MDKETQEYLDALLASSVQRIIIDATRDSLVVTMKDVLSSSAKRIARWMMNHNWREVNILSSYDLQFVWRGKTE